MTPPKLLIVGATGWFGRTLVHEYLSRFGLEHAGRLTLCGSRDTFLPLSGDLVGIVLPVIPLSSLADDEEEPYDTVFWYAFLLRNLIPHVGLAAYRQINDRIAQHVFEVLARHQGARCVFASSGAVFEHNGLPDYDYDPYSHLKLVYERRLRDMADATVVYPYAVTGSYLPNPSKFALGSFIEQALDAHRIVIHAPVPVVRSYGSVHDLSAYLLTALSAAPHLPRSIVPVGCTLDLIQLAVEVGAALALDVEVVAKLGPGRPDVYVANDYSYARQLAAVGLRPSSFADQVRRTAQGPAFEI